MLTNIITQSLNLSMSNQKFNLKWSRMVYQIYLILFSNKLTFIVNTMLIQKNIFLKDRIEKKPHTHVLKHCIFILFFYSNIFKEN